jgi:predicted flap endonuclease-1-like 5' DNA nuclease
MSAKPDSTHPNAAAFPHGLSGPALRALAYAGIRSMAQLAQWREKDVADLHGMGPKGVRMLREGLAAQSRHFKREA